MGSDMDPDAVLKEIRAVVMVLEEDFCCAEHAEMAGTDLAEKVHALDEWLTKGGLLPKEWER